MSESEARGDRFRELDDVYEDFQVNDRDGDKIGKVDDLFVDETDNPEYVGVKMGFFGMSSTLIPFDICKVDEGDKTITVDAEKSHVKDGPNFDDDEDISPDFERQVRDYYGLGASGDTEDVERGAYGDYYRGDEDRDDDRDTDRDADRDDVGVAGSAAGSTAGASSGTRTGDGDEVTVERTEEELAAGTRQVEREGGGVRVRKRTRTDRERLRVPKRREEVSVERVAVDDDDSQAETLERGEATESGGTLSGGDDEISVPVTEEEVVVEKKPVVKEELRIRKDVVEDEEVIEEDVRKEEIDVEEGDDRR